MLRTLVISIIIVISTSVASPAADDVELLQAAFNGEIVTVRALAKAGANLDVKDKSGMTALMYALKGHSDVALMLISHKADVNAKGNNGANALGSARARGNKLAIQLLIDAGAR